MIDDGVEPIGLLLALAIAAAGCAAGAAFRQGDAATRAGNLDEAVTAYRRAVQADPDNPNFKIALERAMTAASRSHLERARQFEDQDQLEAALSEYRLASEYDPSNRAVLMKVAALDQTHARPQPKRRGPSRPSSSCASALRPLPPSRS